MIPFLGMGTDQLAKRAVGEPGTGDNKKFGGNDGTENDNSVSKDLNNPLLDQLKYMHLEQFQSYYSCICLSTQINFFENLSISSSPYQLT